MTRERSFSQRFRQWLDRFGFTEDPFAIYEANQERRWLPYFFVDRPYLHDILGDPSRPQTAFLLAGRGEGKTATHEMVVYECTHAPVRYRALAVRYYDFGALLEQVNGDARQITAQHHVRAIVRATIKALIDLPPANLGALEESDRGLLLALAVAFADPASRYSLGQVLGSPPASIPWDECSPVEILELTARLVMRLALAPKSTYQALYILVDRVDETPAGPEGVVPLLAPLLREGPLLEASNVAFKFFLPTSVGEHLLREVAVRSDRLCIQRITWSQQALRRMIEQRLAYYSEGKVERLEELCATAAKVGVMERLVNASADSPRTLLRLCQRLIHHHVERAEQASALISHTELQYTLHNSAHELKVERAWPISGYKSTTPTVTASQPAASGLHLDETGHVWVDGQVLAPPLSDLEFRLLNALYHQAPDIVSHETLIDAVWPPGAWLSGPGIPTADRQNLRKLVTRLRARLGPGSSGRNPRFLFNARGRGYWLKTK